MTVCGWRARPFLAKVHRYAGLGMALFLIVNGLTGALLAFYHELDQALNPGLFQVPERRTPALGPDALVAAVQKAYPDTQASFLTLHRADGESVHVRLSGRGFSRAAAIDANKFAPAIKPDIDEVYLDPYDGRILGDRQTDALRVDRIHLMPFLYRLHHSLHLPERWGIWLMGLVALAWMFDCLVGVYLTLPTYRNPKKLAYQTASYPTYAAGRNWWQRWKPA